MTSNSITSGRDPNPKNRGTPTEGEIDALIRELADEHDATFVTSDLVQSEVAQAKGLAVEYVAPRTRDVEQLVIEDYFDEQTMSVHLKVEGPADGEAGRNRRHALSADSRRSRPRTSN